MKTELFRGLLIICLITSGCKSELRIFFVQFDEIEGIAPTDPIWIGNTKVGQILSTNISKSYTVVLEVSIVDSLLPLETNTAFQIKPSANNQALGLFLILGDGEDVCQFGDTLQGIEYDDEGNELHTISRALNTLQSVLDTTKSDSLINELEGLRLRVDSVEAMKRLLDSMNSE